MLFEHFSHNLWNKDEIRSIPPSEQSTGLLGEGRTGKPNGLWVSPVNDPHTWEKWCQVEHFALDRLRYRFVLDINITRLLWLRSEEDVQSFHNAYGRNVWAEKANGFEHWQIDWRRVQNESGKDGIMIAPYQWNCRMASHISDWYYPWDCSSGVIWTTDCIRSMEIEDAL